MISPAPRGIVAANPAVAVPLAGIEVTLPGVGTTYTDAQGNFSLPYAGTAKKSVTISLAAGQWWSELKDEFTLPVQKVTGVLDPAGPPTSFLFNAVPSEFGITRLLTGNIAWAVLRSGMSRWRRA